MKSVFVDTSYFVAILNPKDQWHQRASEARQTIGVVHVVTSEWVLAEVLNYFAESHTDFRRAAAKLSHELADDAGVELVVASHENYAAGLALYQSRLDKGYSLTDCISMDVMRERGITEILTYDHHFTQEGFTVLM